MPLPPETHNHGLDAFCVIPARFASSRFPGKPLVHILGKPMVLWVAEACKRAIGVDRVIVATEDLRIKEIVERAGFRAEMTSTNCMTGTDRVAEVARKLSVLTVLNVQGDEPMVASEDIVAVAKAHAENPGNVINGYTALSPREDPSRTTIPKVVLDEKGSLVYASRRDIPGSKNSGPSQDSTAYLKQVCIYAFSPEHLENFSARNRKTPLEMTEDIEILRFIEMGQKVQMIRTREASAAVDTPEDVKQVEAEMLRRGF